MQEMQETQVRSLDGEDPLEDMATHSSILAWRIPRKEEPGRLQTIGSQSQTQLKQRGTHHTNINKSKSVFSIYKEICIHWLENSDNSIAQNFHMCMYMDKDILDYIIIK